MWKNSSVLCYATVSYVMLCYMLYSRCRCRCRCGVSNSRNSGVRERGKKREMKNSKEGTEGGKIMRKKSWDKKE